MRRYFSLPLKAGPRRASGVFQQGNRDGGSANRGKRQQPIELAEAQQRQASMAPCPGSKGRRCLPSPDHREGRRRLRDRYRWAPLSRLPRRAVVRQCRTWPPGDQGRDHGPARQAAILHLVPGHDAFPLHRLVDEALRDHRRRGDGKSLLQLRRFGCQRDGAEDRPAILAARRRAGPDQDLLLQERLSRPAFRRDLGRRHRRLQIDFRVVARRFPSGRIPIPLPQPLHARCRRAIGALRRAARTRNRVSLARQDRCHHRRARHRDRAG